ncbi:hypothetical protein [Sinosporangium siamense]|uniref:DivIVA protein n=1 Tax=Sinosporangium siamense TaxID=1367973 RepID=A0A919RM28_9ACTN|nr:hypothetical protein [Sinosporangium siamense]GII95697.1 hypothetical protein Ssi02_59280 [Sinosporangium siamense]
MTNQHESFPDLMQEDSFEVVMRGYSRRQVHDYMVRTRNQVRDLEERLARAIDQAEQGRIELAEARRRLAEAPQDYDELSQRLAQILKLGEEEAAAKRETADAEAAKTRDEAAQEAEQVLTSAREQSEQVLSAAQNEAERRVGEATAAAERMLAQAGSDAEETLNAARAEADDTLRTARAEADRLVTTARHEAESTVENARAEADSTLTAARNEAEDTLTSARSESENMLTSAQRRASSLDEHTGRRVAHLTETHNDVMRRFTDLNKVLDELMHREKIAGPLIDEASVLPPPPSIVPKPSPVPQDEEPAEEPDVESVRVIVDDEDVPRRLPEESADTHGPAEGNGGGRFSDDTDVNMRLGEPSEVRDPFTPVRK